MVIPGRQPECQIPQNRTQRQRLNASTYSVIPVPFATLPLKLWIVSHSPYSRIHPQPVHDHSLRYPLGPPAARSSVVMRVRYS